MKREEKNEISRQRIIDAAMEEFSHNGYAAASMNTICSENGISKGIIYHYFKSKDELYLLCAEKCFEDITAYLNEVRKTLEGTAEQKMRTYFDARLQFFADHPMYLGIFSSITQNPPENLDKEIAECRKAFDAVNVSVLREVLKSIHLRKGLSTDKIIADFGLYMDFYNMRFKAKLTQGKSAAEALKEHEENCHRQLSILLYGVSKETEIWCASSAQSIK